MSAPRLCVALAAASLGAAATALGWLRRRLELVARAEHELRGPATVLSLACEQLARDPGAARHAATLGAQLDRLGAGLADLEAARTGRRAATRPEPIDLFEYTRATLIAWGRSTHASLEWPRTTVRVAGDRGRLAQALGNLIANAAEHGGGELHVRAGRSSAGVRLELSNRHRSPATRPTRPPLGRGRGLTIASAAARDLGGRLLVETDGGATRAVLELPEAAEPGAVAAPVSSAASASSASPESATAPAWPAVAASPASPSAAASLASPAAPAAQVSPEAPATSASPAAPVSSPLPPAPASPASAPADPGRGLAA